MRVAWRRGTWAGWRQGRADYGGSRGIGFAIAKAFIREGAAVAVSGKSPGESSSNTAHALSEGGGKVVGFAADVSDEVAVAQMGQRGGALLTHYCASRAISFTIRANGVRATAKGVTDVVSPRN
jgi:NAD(P)-dependent dehydrogenase (short-subunit alcohol dehydrogenase family)